jgi:hypothetical protein
MNGSMEILLAVMDSDQRIHVVAKKVNCIRYAFVVGKDYCPEKEYWANGTYDFDSVRDALNYIYNRYGECQDINPRTMRFD